ALAVAKAPWLGVIGYRQLRVCFNVVRYCKPNHNKKLENKIIEYLISWGLIPRSFASVKKNCKNSFDTSKLCFGVIHLIDKKFIKME
ncbi:MAG: hypothetical protein KDK90_27680, partial [Leptospiraceae bacterium]|nr:hypothetical protein [Leptospiraceae bacterium]